MPCPVGFSTRGARRRTYQYVTARLRRLCLTATSAWPMGSPGGEPSATLRCCRRGEHPEASNRRRQRSELRPRPKEEAMSHPLAVVLRAFVFAMWAWRSWCLGGFFRRSTVQSFERLRDRRITLVPARISCRARRSVRSRMNRCPHSKVTELTQYAARRSMARTGPIGQCCR